MTPNDKLTAITICSLLDHHGSFEELCRSILRTQGFDVVPDEDIEAFFNTLNEKGYDEIYSAVFNFKVEVDNLFKKLEEVMNEKEI